MAGDSTWSPSESERKQISAMAAAAQKPDPSFTALSLSGIPGAQNVGTQLQAQKSRGQQQQARGLRASMEAEANRKQQMELARLRNQRVTGVQNKEDARALRSATAAARRGMSRRRQGKLTSAQGEEMSDLAKLYSETRFLSTTYKDSYQSLTGPTGSAVQKAVGAVGILPWTKEVKEEAAWWKRYESQIKLLERNSLFGGALTPTEQKSWEQADINRGMDAAELRKNLKIRADLTEKKLREAAYAGAEIGGTASNQVRQLLGGDEPILDIPDLPSGMNEEENLFELQQMVEQDVPGATEALQRMGGDIGASAGGEESDDDFKKRMGIQ